MTGWQIWAAVGTGGAIGAMTRHAIALASLRLFGPAFPWGTLFVNVAGSFAIGAFLAWLAARGDVHAGLRAFVGTGLLGALTTFSTFSFEALLLWRRSPELALGYVLASVVLALAAVTAGYTLAKAWS